MLASPIFPHIVFILHNSALILPRFVFIFHNSALIILLSALLVYRFATNVSRANQHNLAADTGLDPGWAILADKPVPPALISGSFEEKVALEYLDKVWAVAPPMIITDPGQLKPATAAIDIGFNRYITRRAVAIVPDAVQLDAMTPQAAGLELIALPDTPPRQLPPTAQPLDRPFGEALRLSGWERVAGPLWQIALYWQTSTALDYDYTISVRPLVGGQVVMVGEEALIQDHQPVWGMYPTSHWITGIIVRDVYALALPDGVEPDAVQIVVYRATDDGFENLAEHVIPLAKGVE